MAIRVRNLTDEERRRLDHPARSRTVAARQIERGKSIGLSAPGLPVPTIAKRVSLPEQTGREWLKRFNQEGGAGLQDKPRPGKPPTHTPEQRSAGIVTALTNPPELDQPFGSWRLDRLQGHLPARASQRRERHRHQAQPPGPTPDRGRTTLAHPGDLLQRASGVRALRDEAGSPGTHGARPPSSQKGSHRDALHSPSPRQRGSLLGAVGAPLGQELSGHKTGEPASRSARREAGLGDGRESEGASGPRCAVVLSGTSAF